MRSIKLSPAHLAVTAVLAAFLALPATVSALPLGWTCIGTCGTSGADGVVTAPPGGTTYDWVATTAGPTLGLLDLNLGFETNGSILRSIAFVADAGDDLQFFFNYVTSDGAGYADYAWARLLDESLNQVALLFTARTTPGGDTVPGFGMPANSATLTPPTTPIIPGGPVWSPLGGDSGFCWDIGCGYTGWIQSNYLIGLTGTYILEFGTVNWDDTFFQSGLAFAGTTIDGVPLQTAVPEPGTLALLGSGLVLAARRLRSRRRSA